jgi:hypothetical protein
VVPAESLEFLQNLSVGKVCEQLGHEQDVETVFESIAWEIMREIFENPG